jgi:predicted phage terminase large subunit-like protein
MSSDTIVLNLLRRDFLAFAAKAFNILNPGQELVPTVGFLAMAHKLGEVAQGKCRRLIINVPPRSGKSLLGSVALPSFVLGHDPTRRIICASYSGELAAKFARDTRTLMQHDVYGVLFPATVITGKNTETELETAHGGFRYATSVGGTLTGRGGNLIIIDDPQKPDQAMSAAASESVWQWFTQTLASRLDNKAEDAIVVIMQRLHIDDLTGRLLAQGGWELLSIPAIADQRQSLLIRPGRRFVREPGHLLDPHREPLPVLDGLRDQLGSSTFVAQYQQRPVPLDGALIKKHWLRWYDLPPTVERNDLIIQSWDSAYKRGEHNDYSVCSTWRLRADNEQAFLIDLWRERVDFPTLLERVRELHSRYRPHLVLVEDAGCGAQLMQMLERQKIRTCPIKPLNDKITRLCTGSVLIQGGHILLLAQAPWLDALLSELLAFPEGTHDDQVDSISQFLNWLSERRQKPRWGGPCVINYGEITPVSSGLVMY